MMHLFLISLRLATRHRALWGCGVLIALLDGQCLRLGAVIPLGGQRRVALLNALGNVQGDSVVTAASLVVISVFSYWLFATLGGNWALGALIAGVESARVEDKARLTAMAQAGVDRFWSMSVIGLFIAVPAVLLFAIDAVFGLVALFTRQPLFEALLLIWLPVAVVLGLALSIVGEVAQVDVVLRGRGPIRALGYGFRLLRRSPWRLLGVWLLTNALLGSLLVMVTAGPVGFVVIPWLVESRFGITGTIVMLLVLAIALLLAGFGVVLHRALWVLAYRALSNAAPVTPLDQQHTLS